jgi:hypothetical protein
MNAFESALSRRGLDAKDASEVRDLLESYWLGELSAKESHVFLRALIGGESAVSDVEEAFAESETKFDLFSSMPRLKRDPFWKISEESLPKMRSTGRCGWCGGSLQVNEFFESCACVKCGRLFFFRPRYEPKPEFELVEAVPNGAPLSSKEFLKMDGF